MNKKLKSKVVSFQVLGTKPEDYAVSFKVHAHKDHCDLCGSALDHSFELVHNTSTPDNRDKNIFIGADCVDNFMEAHFPLKKEEIRKKLKNLIEKSKSGIFLEKNPDILVKAQEVRKYILSDFFNEAKDNSLLTEYYSFRQSDLYDQIMKDVKSIIRKNYLSKPKTEKFYLFLDKMKSGELLSLLKEANEKRKMKIVDDMKTDPDFYSLYLEIYKRFDVNQVRALDNFEKQDFLVRNKKSLKLVLLSGIY